MKKSYFLMAAAATMFAACSQTDFVNEAAVVESNASQAIGFEGFAGKSTRTEFANVAALQGANGGFKVWGYTGTAVGDVVFNGDNVDYVGSAWTYDDGDTDLKYWEAAKTYSFYAVAPKSANASCDATTGEYTINGAKSGNADDVNVIDYLTAAPKTGISGSLGQTVNFDFSHVMSKISLALATTAAEVKLQSVTMTGWDAADGTYASEHPEVWTLATPAVAGSAEFYNAGAGFTALASVTNLPSFLIVPQTNNIVFTLTYKVGEITYENKTVTINAQEWLPNEHTTYTINIGPGAITFGVNSVEDWDPASESGTVE